MRGALAGSLFLLIVGLVAMMRFNFLLGSDHFHNRLRPDVEPLFLGADDGAKHIRLIGQIAGAGAVADRLDGHRRQARAEFIDEGGDDACAGRRC